MNKDKRVTLAQILRAVLALLSQILSLKIQRNFKTTLQDWLSQFMT